MVYSPTIISIVEVLIVSVPVLLTVAFVTVAERKTMASMQRRLGPNIVGYYGLLQAFADALKLILKEYVSYPGKLGPIFPWAYNNIDFLIAWLRRYTIRTWSCNLRFQPGYYIYVSSILPCNPMVYCWQVDLLTPNTLPRIT